MKKIFTVLFLFLGLACFGGVNVDSNMSKSDDVSISMYDAISVSYLTSEYTVAISSANVYYDLTLDNGTNIIKPTEARGPPTEARINNYANNSDANSKLSINPESIDEQSSIRPVDQEVIPRCRTGFASDVTIAYIKKNKDLELYLT